MTAHNLPIDVRFMLKVSPEPNSGCWLWAGAVNKNGYGHFSVTPKDIVSAHRFSWQLHRGFLPAPDVYLCHKCDVRICVNPDHLFCGSHAVNMEDMRLKGRAKGRGNRRVA